MKKLILYGAVLFASCGGSGDKKTSAVSLDTTALVKQPVTDTVKEAVDSFNVQMDSIIEVRFSPDSSLITVEGHLTRRGDPVICYIPVKRGKRLSAILIPDKEKANIRISHIYMPDGSTDGPFGQTLEYKLKGEGLYKLYITPNRMAGDPMAVDFRLRIRID